MIRSRRQAHRVAFLVLAIALAAVLTAGLAFRPELPPPHEAPEALEAQSGFSSAPDGSWALVADGTFLVSKGRDANGRSLTIRPVAPILKPDLLVYWIPESAAPSASGELPTEGTVLVGSLAATSPRRLSLPEDTDQGAGEIVIYSLGHKEVVARFSLRSALSPSDDTR